MARRVSMPAADDLFRPTADAEQAAPEQRPRRVRAVADDAETVDRARSARAAGCATTRR